MNDKRKAPRAEHDSVLDWVLHEMAGPLTAISGYADIAADPGSPPEDVAGAIEVIRQESGRLLRLTEEIRSMARITGGKPVRVNLSRFDLAELCKGALAVQKLAYPGYGYVLRAEGPAMVTADRDKTMEIALNLLANSAKYSRSGSEIILSAGREGDRGILRVEDRGCGIAEDDLERIFSLGKRLDSGLHTDGRGIGLFLVKTLAEAMNGSIEVKSRPGEGSRFTVSLPLC